MITFEGILIGTGILWVLTAILVVPLTNYVVKQRLKAPAYAHVNGDMEKAAELPGFKTLVTTSYIVVDMLVLGTAGFLMGLIMGWYFMGISFEARGWPGMIAFIVASIMGSTIHVSQGLG